MMQEELFHDLLKIAPADERAKELAKRRWNSVAKPIGSLGILEEDIIKIAGITGRAFPVHVGKSALAVMCADHGVVEEGVTQTSQDVTRIVAENFTKNQTSVTIMCQVAGTDVFPVDIGMVGETPKEETLKPFVLLNRKTAFGSKNLVREPAMERRDCEAAVLSGIRLAGDLKAMGYEIIATGEMGIGNTTPSSALTAILTKSKAETVTGRGAGLSDEGLLKKKRAVSLAVERVLETYPQWESCRWGEEDLPEETLTLLSELGGFDIAGMTGLFLGAAVHRIPVVIDGYISSVAALLAVCICGRVRDFILASHVSSEPAGRMVMDMMGLHGPLDCGMHLGEGSGAVAFLPLLKMGADVYEKMSTFEDIQVESYVDYEAERSKGE